MPNAEAYAKLHRDYLQNSHPELYQKLKDSGELLPLLQKKGQEAVDYEENLTAQMATSKDLPDDYLERVKALEGIPLQVHELVMNDVIYNDPPPKQQ
jgi:hypothetical protein